jgi:ribosome-binding protein aMBF1 (putative translation factor)
MRIMCGFVRNGGAMQAEDWLHEARAEEIARKVREELARRRISRQALADMARISISTLEKALSGRRAFTLATVIRLEEALGTTLRGQVAAMRGGRSSGSKGPMSLFGPCSTISTGSIPT